MKKRLSFTRLGAMGRLGNQMMQVWALIALAKKHDMDFVIPEWELAKYLENGHLIPQENHVKYEAEVNEPGFEFQDLILDRGKDTDVIGYFQSEKNWLECAGLIKGLMKWKKDFQDKMSERFKMVAGTEYVAVHVRRGDYINNPNYYQTPTSYFLNCMKQFNNDNTEFRIFSDDIAWCKIAFADVDRPLVFMEGNTEVEDFCMMTMCHHFIISNSSFSLCAAWLAEIPNFTKVFAPAGWMDGELASKCNGKDIVPERWMRGAPKTKIDLRDVTFTIPVKLEHRDRKENLELNICYLRHNFDTNIIIGEHDTQERLSYVTKWGCEHYFAQNYEHTEFHRTKLLNDMAMMAKTPIVVNWDADVFIDPEQILEAVELLRQGKADGVYPYDGKFFRVERSNMALLQKDLNVDSVMKHQYAKYMYEQESYGGAVMWNKEKFIQGGMENEWMIHWGPEDYERYERFTRLGFVIKRVKGGLYHLDHYTSPESRDGHKYFKTNEQEYYRIKQIPVERLKEQVETWPWVCRYSDAFFNSINETALQAADEILPVVMKLTKAKTILDIGCGQGAWGVSIDPENYFGIDGDYVKKLLVDRTQFKAIDLSKPFDIGKKFDLVICMEVAEHLPEESADAFIDSICKHADTVLFSAAIPGQGGNNHLNEQWQSYWAEKFKQKNLHRHEIRDLFWTNKKIPYYYKQNMMLFTRNAETHYVFKVSTGEPLDMIHPDKWEEEMVSREAMKIEMHKTL